MESMVPAVPMESVPAVPMESVVPEVPMESVVPEVLAGRIPCPACGRLLRIRTLAEKHTCVRKPRAPRKMNPDKLLARRRAAAERRFLSRRAKSEAA